MVVAIALAAAANERSRTSLQSGNFWVGTPVSDRGLHGEGQIIAVLDTGVDYDSCYFAELDGRRPPVNTGSPSGGLAWSNVDLSRRKIVAYDFLYSCDQFPGARGCESPDDPAGWDNTGHGTHNAAAIAGDQRPFVQYDFGDGLASGAKLIVQDGGFIGGDACAQRPGFGCPVDLTPILDQAYRQGERIHSNSWGDRQGAPPSQPAPVANYSQSARDVDAFVWSHPDMLVIFNTGNLPTTQSNPVPAGAPPPMSVSAPGVAKNALQVGGVRPPGREDDVIAYNTLFGPTRDGRIKPDLVGPSTVIAGDGDRDAGTNNCSTSSQGPGTSWSAPSVAAAAALVRQYYTEGFYPSGTATPANVRTPSAALLKATLIASARPAAYRATIGGDVSALPAPSYEQGFGVPVLDDALYFPGDATKLRVVDTANASGLQEGETRTLRVASEGGKALRVVLVWTDPAGVPRGTSDSTAQLVNDLDLRVTGPSGGVRLGNEALHPGQADRLNNVESVSIAAAAAGTYTISVSATRLAGGPRQGYALVVTGGLSDGSAPSKPRAARSR